MKPGENQGTVTSRKNEPKGKDLPAVVSLLPELHEGITRVQYTGDRPLFQLLVGGQLQEGGCVWIDAENHSSTYALADVAGEEALEKVRIGRAFTPFQHHQLCTSVEDFIDEETEIIALPAANGLYEEGQINADEAEELLQESLEHVKEIAEKRDLKVVISNSREAEGELEYLTGIYSGSHVTVKETREGLRFSSENFRTTVYPDTGKIQTTLPLWLEEVEKDGKNKRYVQTAP